jgi:mRNA-degrading endonuclease YafQ of YafQ-DinJ toxin-antitoxin module
MIDVVFTPSFLRQLKSFEITLQEEAIAKVELFKNIKNHRALKVHKLKGRLKGRWSFSVNYRLRIVFSYISKRKVIMLAVGDHSEVISKP